MVPERLHRVLRLDVPDDASVAYRVVTAGCVVVSVLAAVLQEAVSLSLGISAVLLVPVGFVFSYARRGHRNVVLKIILTAGLLLSFAAFLNGVQGATSVDDTRAPLVAVFLWVQVMHSFDVPRARDLTFSVAASVVLIALAGSLAFSSGFIVFVLIHAALLIAALVLAYRAELRKPDARGVFSRPTEEAEHHVPSGDRNKLLRRGGLLVALTLVATSVVFVFLPRFPATQLASLPFSLGNNSPIEGFTGGVSQPPDAASDVGSSEAFDPDHYFGYGEALNLRARGQLSDELVMRVRSPRPTLYRAQAFDQYVDGRWSSTDGELLEERAGSLGSILIGRPAEEAGVGTEVVQTFYIERELPNIVFHAYLPSEVYISTSRVMVDDFTSIRTPFTLEADTIYSVISRVPDRDVERLRFAPPADTTDPSLQRYLQLPPTLSDRFRELSTEITGPHASAVDKAEAVQTWLKENKQYRLDISRDPPGRDPVDYFVFERNEGFCEQIAATMALMLRASGVPTRVVTGFGEGQRNLFTGYWEVRNSDAHAWVEVFYPSAGWVPYDPTFGVPIASAANTTFMLAPLAKISSAIPAAAGAARRAMVRVVDVLPGPGWAAALAIAAGLAFAGAGVARARTNRRRVGRIRADRIVDGWLMVEDALASKGWKREPFETVWEFARRAGPGCGADIGPIAAEFGALRYGPPSGADIEAWERRTSDTARTIRHTKVAVGSR